MSIAASKGEGDVGLSIFYHSSGRRPFLRRNVRKSLQHLTMGPAISKITELTASMGAKPSNALDPRYLDGDNDEDDDREGDPRPTKRRKLNALDWGASTMRDSDESSSRQPLGQLMSNNPRAVKPGMVQPSDFYGRSKLKLRDFTLAPPNTAPVALETKSHINDIIPESRQFDFTKSLRVDLKEINLKPSSEYPDQFEENDSYIPCRVAASIHYCQDEDKQWENFTEISKSVQLGRLHVTVAESGSGIYSRQFTGLEPFYFLSEDFFVRRKKRKSNGQWGGFENTWGLADRYRLVITIESTNFHAGWPSVCIPEGDITQALEDGEHIPSDFKMYAKTNLGMNPERHTRVPMFLHHHNSSRRLEQAIPYTLSLQARWSIPNGLKNTAPLSLEALKSEPPAMLMPPPSPAAVEIFTTDDRDANTPEVEIDSTLAANRARRDRTNVSTYNLKTLSTIAQGKSPRKERAKEPITEETGTTVTYSIHHGDAADTGVKQRTVVQSLACGFCSATNRTVEDLRLHLHTEHGAFKFSYRHGPPRVQFFVEIVKPRVGPMLDIDRAKTFQMIKTRSLFDLEEYLSGHAWIKSRQGPQHGLWPNHLQERAHESSSSASPHDSRYSSPNTSHSADDDMGEEVHEEKQDRPRKVILVPKTVKPLYHSTTKRLLIPGEELPDDERDESWLDQKHRDLVDDFTDVTTDEKDFINGGWNPFINKQGLTSPKYLPAAIMQFVELKKDWFAERSSRKTEFALQLQVFILRGDLTHDVFDKCMDVLKKAEEAKKQREKENPAKDAKSEKTVSKSRGIQSCICGKHTEPPNRIICVGEKCPARFFCKTCAKDYGRPLVKGWVCNEHIST